jgi:hypothetical protein
VEFLLLLLLSYAFVLCIKLLNNYQRDNSSHTFYALETKSHLLVTIVTLSIVIKLLLFPFFFETLNSLSSLIPGAMCSAGVVSANSFGAVTVLLKTLSLFVGLLWLRLNKEDETTQQQPYFKKKLWLFHLFYIMVAVELYLELSFFINLSTDSPVLCCSSLFDTDTAKNILLRFDALYLLLLFVLLFFTTLLLNHYKRRYLATLSMLLFSYVAYYALVYIFTPYIYELPTHKCPYCMMQHEYNFLGYFIYFSLFMALYYSFTNFFFSFERKSLKKSSLFLLLFFLLSTGSFFLYIFKNNTLLFSLF